MLTASLVTATPALAEPVTLTSGHVDILDVNYVSDNLNVKVRDETSGAAVERNPADVTFQVPAAAKTTVPSGSAWSFLGTAGSTVWVLPQSQVSNLIWPGWNTADVAGGVFDGNRLTFELVSVTGGQFSIYRTSLGSPTVLFHSRDSGPKTQYVSAGSHAHANWAFNTAGTYTVTFKVTGTLAGTTTTKTSGNVSFTFQVLNS
ncbi:choice-of-anchor M domain-containing protein [Actinomadura alba]|nr:choice-of-anchor M domain-containing protein [Actinomadura alba]